MFNKNFMSQFKNNFINLLNTYFSYLDFYNIFSSPVCINNISNNNIKNISFLLDLNTKKKIFLQTSPELCMKNFLLFMYKNIFQISYVYRNKEQSAIHLPSFLMLEWYRFNKNSLQCIINDVLNIFKECIECISKALSKNLKTESFKFNSMNSKLRYYNIKDLWKKYVKINLQECLDALYSKKPYYLRSLLTKKGYNIPQNFSFNDTFFYIMSYQILPKIRSQNYIIIDWPAIYSLCSRYYIDNNLFSERFEIYINNIEIANGCYEKLSASSQNSSIPGFSSINGGGLNSLSSFNEVSGGAIGIDRLISGILNINTIKNSEIITTL